ncbi:MAG: SIS domain-containing protein [bacterium]|jgi:glucosamine--fructose-6-phosphate aminotransferase (isomerizing)|nr:SIS domain-containing protein [bacterium]MDD3805845.1 SIS domain-containing protein [bacterium]MDD4557876.1 SIS domain-containing protein [bacterium]
MHLMVQEIHEQPKVLQQIIKQEEAGIASICEEIKARDIRFIIIAARGTSDNASTYAKYLFQINNGLPVAMAAPSLFTLYEADIRMDNTLIIGVSQSGAAPDVISVVENARQKGAMTIAITNEEGSPLAVAAERAVYCRAGKELSVAATKTYTSQLAIFYLLSSLLKGDKEAVGRLASVGEKMERLFETEKDIECGCERYRYMNECMVIGRGMNYATALEMALKLKETCYVVAEPFSAADLMHGPIALVEEGFPVILFALSGRTYPNMLQLTKDLNERKAETIVISDMPEALDLGKTAFRLPAIADEGLSPLVGIVAGQLFAYYLSYSKGYDPDKPRSLRKVTLTK